MGVNATAKIPDVVYHEYGHALMELDILELLGGGCRMVVLNEGYADLWALSLTGITYSWYMALYDNDPTVIC